MNKKAIITIAVAAAVGGVSLFYLSTRNEEEFKLIPKEKVAIRASGEIEGTEVGTGWSI